MKKEKRLRIILIIAIIIVLVGITTVSYSIFRKYTFKPENPIATIEIEEYGTITVELYPDQAPNTVANFIKLANNGFYDGLTFNRTIPNSMLQGGDKKGDGTGVPSLSDLDESLEDKEYTIKGEFIANKYKNTIKMERGVIAMYRFDYSDISETLAEQGYNSAGSQFFILHGDQPAFNGVYAGFGRVIDGMDVVDKIASVEVYYRDSELAEGEEKPKDENGNTINSDTPKVAPVIKEIRVDTKQVDYGTPDTVDPFDYYSWLMNNYYSSSSSY